MKTNIFDGNAFAQKKLELLKNEVIKINKPLKLISIVHKEDKIGLTYTNLKKEASKLLGIEFNSIEISFKDKSSKTINTIQNISKDQSVNGLLIQKPSKSTWSKFYKGKLSFFDWWEQFTNEINPKKDVDCLARTNLDTLYEGKSSFLPATAAAVLDILRHALNFDPLDTDWGDLVISIVGKSELAGKPLSEKLSQWGAKTYLLGSKDDLMEFLPRSDIVISATGVSHLITNDLIKQDSIIIDLGEPKPDVDFENVSKKASFITPVPGGVGPVTIFCLFQNLIHICSN